MSLEAVCRINAKINRVILNEIVPNDLTSINNKLTEMGIENTTGLNPSNEKIFIMQMRRQHKKLRDLAFTELVRDTETEELYILIKESENNIRNVIRTMRANRRFKNRDKFGSIIQ